MKVRDDLHIIVASGISGQSTMRIFYDDVETIRILLVGNSSN